MKKVSIFVAVFILVSALLTGCSGSPRDKQTGTPVITNPPPNEIGYLQVVVADAPPSASVDHIWMTLVNIETHQGGSGPWTLIDSNPPLFDLKLTEGSQQVLTSQTLLVGTYTQIHFELANVAIQNGPTKNDAKLSHDDVRLVENFKIVAGETTKVILDFNASESLIFNSQGEYLFDPVVHLLVSKPGVLGIVTPGLDNGEIGAPYRAGLRPQLQAIGGTKPYKWSISVGALPPGLSLNAATGVISGNPSHVGSYIFTVQVTDSSTPAQTNSMSFTVRIAPALGVVIATTSLPNGEQGEPYVAVLDAIFGVTPLTFTVSSGSLPDGLTMFGFGSQGSVDISGTPTKSGDYSFSITVTDSSSPPQSDTQDFNLFIK